MLLTVVIYIDGMFTDLTNFDVICYLVVLSTNIPSSHILTVTFYIHVPGSSFDIATIRAGKLGWDSPQDKAFLFFRKASSSALGPTPAPI